jgi:hypothetical protein
VSKGACAVEVRVTIIEFCLEAVLGGFGYGSKAPSPGPIGRERVGEGHEGPSFDKEDV